MKKEILIVLPKRIAILRDSADQPLKVNKREINIYFKNIILPYKEEYDVRVNCNYGQNFGSFWRISEFPVDVDRFDFEIVIYNEYGECVASKSSVIELYDADCGKPFNLLCIGDSMTKAQKYIEHISTVLNGVKFVGSRSFNGLICHEGRGGWRYDTYFNAHTDEGADVSPFLFPKDTENYMGDVDFINKANDPKMCEYFYDGYKKQAFCENAVYGRDGKLYLLKNGDFEIFEENPKWEFSFEKYVKSHNIGNIDAVSVLLGANDLQMTSYENSETEINAYIENTRRFIKEIRKYSKDIDIIINLPVIGAEQYAWGTRCGCFGGSKMYRFNIINVANKLLENFENTDDKHLHISPMLLFIDPENGFPHEYYRANKYSEVTEKHQSNWVHPCDSGYFQMGDALAGTIQKLRCI